MLEWLVVWIMGWFYFIFDWDIDVGFLVNIDDELDGEEEIIVVIVEFK